MQNLSLDAAGSIGEASYLQVKKALQKVNPKRILEFGSGFSSIRMALDFPDAEITSLDHDKIYFERTLALKESFCPNSNLHVMLAPLKLQMVQSRFFLTYDFRKFRGFYDAVIIDGPPTGVTLRGREACLYNCYNHIPVGALIILDDFERSAEKRIVSNWRSVYPGGFSYTEFTGTHSFVLIEKQKEVGAHVNALLLIDSAFTCLAALAISVSKNPLLRPVKKILRGISKA